MSTASDAVTPTTIPTEGNDAAEWNCEVVQRHEGLRVHRTRGWLEERVRPHLRRRTGGARYAPRGAESAVRATARSGREVLCGGSLGSRVGDGQVSCPRRARGNTARATSTRRGASRSVLQLHRPMWCISWIVEICFGESPPPGGVGLKRNGARLRPSEREQRCEREHHPLWGWTTGRPAGTACGAVSFCADGRADRVSFAEPINPGDHDAPGPGLDVIRSEPRIPNEREAGERPSTRYEARRWAKRPRTGNRR